MNIWNKRDLIGLPGMKLRAVWDPKAVSTRMRNTVIRGIEQGHLSVRYTAKSSRLVQAVLYTSGLPHMRCSDYERYGQSGLYVSRLPAPYVPVLKDLVRADEVAAKLNGKHPGYSRSYLLSAEGSAHVSFMNREYLVMAREEWTKFIINHEHYQQTVADLLRKIRAGELIEVYADE